MPVLVKFNENAKNKTQTFSLKCQPCKFSNGGGWSSDSAKTDHIRAIQGENWGRRNVMTAASFVLVF